MSWFDNKLSTRFHLPEIVKGPWTREARQRALDRELLEHYIEYFKRALQGRNWSPWHNFPLDEMRQWGHKLSQETIHLIEGFLGVEEYVGDYVLTSLEQFRDNRTRRNLQLQWGAEEAKHGLAWELVLKHSLARTEEQLKAYLDKVRNFRWSPDQHAGADTPLGISAYAMVQERATYFNYQEMRARIRQEYGLPVNLTREEHARSYEIGASEAFRVVGLDEVAHHGIFLKFIQSYIRYFPSLTFEALTRVFAGFEMPALRFIPNNRHFLRAVNRTDFYSGPKHRAEVHNPVLRSLGLESHEAFEKAVQLARKLPEALGPDSVRLSHTGEWVVGYSQAPAGG
jgi:acyl-[acyl-carrier-protein] desaturase